MEIEDEVLVIGVPGQATPEVNVPDEDQDDGNQTKDVNHVCEGNGGYAQRHRIA